MQYVAMPIVQGNDPHSLSDFTQETAVATEKPWLAVLKAITLSKATWKLAGTVAVLYGCAHGEVIAELIGEVVTDVLGAF